MSTENLREIMVISSVGEMSGWKGLPGGLAHLWKESNASIIKVQKLLDLELDERERQGILSDRMIAASLSMLTNVPLVERYALTKCNLQNLGLTDISALRYCHYLQYLNLENNNLADLSALGDIPHLIHLNAAHNQLTDVLRFSPPWYLTYANLSHNKLTSINNLDEFWSIVHLDLSHNLIDVISGLQNLRYLRYLNLSHNFIECVENLDNLHIQELNLRYNCIKKFRSNHPAMGINVLPNLRTIRLGHNRLSSLKFFKNAYCLRYIDLTYNKLVDLMELSHLGNLVRKLDLAGNPCTKWPKYKEALLHSMPNLTLIDGENVTVSEKIAAMTIFDPPISLLASRGLTKLTLLDQLSVPKSDIPYDQVCPPLIILTGPSAVKKGALGLYMSELLPKKVKYCRSYTTREFSSSAIETDVYYFVEREEFNKMARNGEFLTVEELVGDIYGFHRREITQLKMEKKVGITQMNLQATIQMQQQYPNVRLVLVLAADEKIHREWIETKFKVFNWIKDSVENLWALCIGKPPSEPHVQSKASKISFVTEILQNIIDSMDIFSSPTRKIRLITDSPQASKSMPQKTRQDLWKERRHIKFRSFEGIRYLRSRSTVTSDSELKVIMNEDTNIIVDDPDWRKLQMRERMLKRRKTSLEDPVTGESSSESSVESLDSLSSLMDVNPKYLMDTYIEVVLKSREIYIDQHLKNPGFYSLVLHSDNFEKAVASLRSFIRAIYVNYPREKPRDISELDYINRFVLPTKIENIVDYLRVT